MSDGYIKIGTKIDETGIDKGIGQRRQKAQGKHEEHRRDLLGLAKEASRGRGSLRSRRPSEVIGFNHRPTRRRSKAETQLESAAKNNPYLIHLRYRRSRNYASELQGYSTETKELLPMMASLAAAGRTQDEIMQIMSPLSIWRPRDHSRSTARCVTLISIRRVIRENWRSHPRRSRPLPPEQLKNGAATKLMGDRYKGIAAETAKATGSSEQLANAIGDAKEELGYGWEKSLAPFRRFITEVVGGWAAAKKAQREAQEEKEKAFAGEETISGATYAIADIQKQIDGVLEQIRYAENEGKADLVINEIDAKKFTDALRERVQVLKDQLAQMRSLEIRSREGAKADEAAALAASHAKSRKQGIYRIYSRRNRRT